MKVQISKIIIVYKDQRLNLTNQGFIKSKIIGLSGECVTAGLSTWLGSSKIYIINSDYQDHN